MRACQVQFGVKKKSTTTKHVVTISTLVSALRCRICPSRLHVALRNADVPHWGPDSRPGLPIKRSRCTSSRCTAEPQPPARARFAGPIQLCDWPAGRTPRLSLEARIIANMASFPLTGSTGGPTSVLSPIAKCHAHNYDKRGIVSARDRLPDAYTGGVKPLSWNPEAYVKFEKLQVVFEKSLRPPTRYMTRDTRDCSLDYFRFLLRR